MGNIIKLRAIDLAESNSKYYYNNSIMGAKMELLIP